MEKDLAMTRGTAISTREISTTATKTETWGFPSNARAGLVGFAKDSALLIRIVAELLWWAYWPSPARTTLHFPRR